MIAHVPWRLEIWIIGSSFVIFVHTRFHVGMHKIIELVVGGSDAARDGIFFVELENKQH